MIKLAIVYHSEFGHTKKVALAIADGAEKAGAEVTLIDTQKITPQDWSTLDKADAIAFGSPTYMGGVSAQFKQFIDNASKRWSDHKWKDKIAAGFTNSGSYSGDKLSTLMQLAINATQHGMIWVGQAEMPPKNKGSIGSESTDINRLGSFLGLMTQADNAHPDITPPSGDIETARLFGKRITKITQNLIKH